MKQFIFTLVQNKDGEMECGIYTTSACFECFLNDLEPGATFISFVDSRIKGNTYNARKSDLVNKAIEAQEILSQCDISYSELLHLQNYFEAAGKRYGLLKEFRENCIC